MITELTINNYESHKETILEFPPGLTVFIGESDKGKSGVFRAFNWLRTSRPLGNSMFPLFWDSKETSVSVELDNSYSIRRSKGISLNEYHIYNQHGELEWESNAGTTVPKEVSDLLQMDDDIYFQAQIDRPFLMFESAGERGRILNKIAGLDKIDSCIKNASQDVRRINTERKQAKKNIAVLEEELLQFDNLPAINKLLSEMEELESEIQQTEKTITVIESLIPEKDRLEKVLEKASIVKAISKKVAESLALEESIKTYKDILVRTRSLKLRSKELQDKQNKKDLLTTIANNIDELEKSAVIYKKLESNYDKVNELVVDQWDFSESIRSIGKEIKQIAAKLPNVCPTCGELLK